MRARLSPRLGRPATPTLGRPLTASRAPRPQFDLGSSRVSFNDALEVFGTDMRSLGGQGGDVMQAHIRIASHKPLDGTPTEEVRRRNPLRL